MELTDKKIQVGIIAKQFLFRLGIKTILSVIGIDPEIKEFNDIDSLKLHFRDNNHLDFLVLAEDVFDDNVNHNLNALKKSSPDIKMLLISEAIYKDCPCSKFVLNTDNQKEILDKLQDFFFEPDIIETNKDHVPILSDREIDVLKNVALGQANKAIADTLFISINTVITHRKNITEKLGIKTIAGLTVYAMMNEIIKPEEVKY